MQQRDALGRVACHRQRAFHRAVGAGPEIDGDSYMAEGPAGGGPQARGDQQHRHGCLRYDTLAHRSGTQSVESSTLVTPCDDHVGKDRLRVQQDDLRGVAVLNPISERDLCLIGHPPKVRLQGETLSSRPVEGLVRRDRLNDGQLGAVHAWRGECIVEGTTRWGREVDCCENAREIHDAASRLRGDDSVAPPTSPRGKKRADRSNSRAGRQVAIAHNVLRHGSAARMIPLHASDALQSEMHSST